MFEKFIRWIAQEYINKAFTDGHWMKQKEYQDNKRINLEFRIKESIGKKIIYCSNEWEDPIFGIVSGVDFITKAKSPMLVIKNILTGDVSLIDPTSYLDADEQMVEAILKLNPFERWNIATGTSITTSNMWSKSYESGVELMPTEVIRKKLKEANFI